MTAASVAARTMAAARLVRPGGFAVEEQAVPTPAENEVLVRLEGSGVCASSLPLWEGRPWFEYPLVPGAPGHEGWGVEVDSGRRVAVLGDRAFAAYAAVPRDRIVPLPPALDGRPFPGEALGCAFNVFARSNVAAGETVGIVGCGFLGLLLVQLAVAAGARVLAVSRRESGLELARAFGAETPAHAEDESCDLAIEAAGVQETLETASRLCRVRGRLVIAGYHQDGPRTVDLRSWNWRGLDVVNAHERDPERYLEGMRAAVDGVVHGLVDPHPLYTHTFGLDGAERAFELLHARPEGFVKALVTT